MFLVFELVLVYLESYKVFYKIEGIMERVNYHAYRWFDGTCNGDDHLSLVDPNLAVGYRKCHHRHQNNVWIHL